MSRAEPPVNRFFIHPHFSIFYRNVKRFNWQDEARPDYAIMICPSGELQYEAGHQTGQLRPDEALLLEPSISAKATGQKVSVLLITITPSFFVDYAVRMRLVGPAGNVGFSTTLLHRDPLLKELAESFIRELGIDDAGREIVLTALLEQLAVHLLRNFSNMRRSDELELSRVGLIDRRIRLAVELMHAQLHRELSLKEIASASYLSPFHFARLFKKLTGATPHAYLATLRTKQAQRLLAETDFSITDISGRVGYASSSHFSKAFRQTTGLTPREFRKALVSR